MRPWARQTRIILPQLAPRSPRLASGSPLGTETVAWTPEAVTLPSPEPVIFDVELLSRNGPYSPCVISTSDGLSTAICFSPAALMELPTGGHVFSPPVAMFSPA